MVVQFHPQLQQDPVKTHGPVMAVQEKSSNPLKALQLPKLPGIKFGERYKADDRFEITPFTHFRNLPYLGDREFVRPPEHNVWLTTYKFDTVEPGQVSKTRDIYLEPLPANNGDDLFAIMEGKSESGKGKPIGLIKNPQSFNGPIEIYQGKVNTVAIVRSPHDSNNVRYYGLEGSRIELNHHLRKRTDGTQASSASIELFANDAVDTDHHLEKGTIIEPSSGIELKGKPQDNAMVFILGAGIGTRIHPLTWDDMHLAKPALPIHGEDSILSKLVKDTYGQGFRNFVVHTYYQRDSVMDSLNHTLKSMAKNGEDLPDGTRLIEFKDARPSGTVGGVFQMLKSVHEKYSAMDPDEGKDDIIIIQGDAVTNVRFDELLAAHRKNKALITLGALSKPVEEAYETYGVIHTDPDSETGQSGPIQDFLEKPKDQGDLPESLQGKENILINTGFYIISPQALPYIVEAYDAALKAQQAEAMEEGKPVPLEVGEFDFSKTLFPWMQDNIGNAQLEKQGMDHVLYAQEIDGYWNDVGNPAEYIRTLKTMADGHLGASHPRGAFARPVQGMERSLGRDVASAKIHLRESDFKVQNTPATNHYNSDVVVWPEAIQAIGEDGAKLGGNVIVARSRDSKGYTFGGEIPPPGKPFWSAVNSVRNWNSDLAELTPHNPYQDHLSS